MKISSTYPDTRPILHTKKKVYEKFSVFFPLPPDLAEISAKTQKHQLVHTKFVYKPSLSIKVKFGGDNAEDTRRRSIDV